MNDPQIRQAFHSTFLRKEHTKATTLILDELGLEHGKCRADIAVINGHIDGFEIKSDVDTLVRLSRQIHSYDAIFDHSTIIVTPRHLDDATKIVPEWWGVITAIEQNHDRPRFKLIRKPRQNESIDNYVVAQLLWREEAQDVLFNMGVRGARLKQRRSILYQYIVEMLDPLQLRYTIRKYLKKRQTWRHPASPFLNDD